MFFYVLVVAQLTQGYQPPKPSAHPLGVYSTMAECQLNLARQAVKRELELVPWPDDTFRAENRGDPWSNRLECVEIYQPNFGK